MALHFSHNRLKVLTVASANPLDCGLLTLDCLWMIPFSDIHFLNSSDVKTPSPSLASIDGHVVE